MNKSFILHLDSLQVLDKMTDEQSGKFIKAIYHYQSTGELPVLDFGLDMAITPFINQFKRDKKKWEEEKQNRSYNGRIGNLKKWHPDLYKKFSSGEITLENAESIANDRKASHSDKNDRPPIAPHRPPSPPIANIAVNKNVSKSVSVNVLKDICLEKEFDIFWKNYIPVKVKDKFVDKGSRSSAFKKYTSIVKNTYKKNHKIIQEINIGLQNYLEQCVNNASYTKQVIGFLRNETWKEYQTTNQMTIIAEGNANGNNANKSKSIDEQTRELMREIEEAEYPISQQLRG